MLKPFSIPEKGPKNIIGFDLTPKIKNYDFIEINSLGNFSFRARKDNKYGYCDIHANELIPCKYDYASGYLNGFASVKLNDKWGVVTKDKIIIPFEYDYISRMNNCELFVSKLNGKYGVINKNEEMIIPFEYDHLTQLSNNRVIAYLNNKWGIIDINNNIILDIKYDTITKHANHFYIFIENTWGISNMKGEIIIPCKYRYISESYGFIIGKLDNDNSDMYDENYNLCISNVPLCYIDCNRYKTTNKKMNLIDLELSYGRKAFINIDSPTEIIEFMNYIINIGSRDDTLYYQRYKNTYILKTGCFFGDINAFEKAIVETHNKNNKFFKDYMRICNRLKTKLMGSLIDSIINKEEI